MRIKSPLGSCSIKKIVYIDDRRNLRAISMFSCSERSGADTPGSNFLVFHRANKYEFMKFAIIKLLMCEAPRWWKNLRCHENLFLNARIIFHAQSMSHQENFLRDASTSQQHKCRKLIIHTFMLLLS